MDRLVGCLILVALVFASVLVLEATAESDVQLGLQQHPAVKSHATDTFPQGSVVPRKNRAQSAALAPGVLTPRKLQELGHEDANGEPDCNDNADFAALSTRVMQNCCPRSPAAPGQNATGSDECTLPATCATTECADEFLPFFDACYPRLSALSAEPFRKFDAFKNGCEVSLISPSDILVSPRCIRKIVNTIFLRCSILRFVSHWNLCLGVRWRSRH